MSTRQFLLIATSSLAIDLCVFGQGSLTPPAAPAPTMKTLDQIEARIPISPPVSPATYPITISQSGSYYVTGNLSAATADTNVLFINAANVTVDLNGYTLTSGAEGFSCIGTTDGSPHNIVVKNGNLESGGINLAEVSKCRFDRLSTHGPGALVSAGDNAIVSHCVVDFTGSTGLNVLNTGNGSIILDCVVKGGAISTGNACSVTDSTVTDGYGISSGSLSNCTISNCRLSNVNAGIYLGDHAVVTGCTVSGSATATNGINVGHDSSVSRCAVTSSSIGIDTGDNCTIDACSALSNRDTGIQGGLSCTILGCASKSNIGAGIIAHDSSTVSRCSVRENKKNGIVAMNACTIEGNTVQANAVNSTNGSPYFGILVSGTGNRIENNHFTYQSAQGAGGLKVSTATGGNLVVRNSAYFNSGGGGNFNVAAGNIMAPSANGTNISSATNPNSNYDY
jgi:parallel beta-helix repeat protein